ncbi:MAG: hypothetical protein EA379_05720 [Phycisphaerales bacterium]|nr:MAG: hypothetical protein EA379_05720 [Phycisphaerales bacterium]
MRTARDTGLIVGLLLSVALHASLAWVSYVVAVGGALSSSAYDAAGSGMEYTPPPPPPQPDDAPEEEPVRRIQLGLDDGSTQVSATWIGGPRDEPHAGDRGEIDQAAFSLAPGDEPGPFSIAADASEARPFEPPPEPVERPATTQAPPRGAFAPNTLFPDIPDAPDPPDFEEAPDVLIDGAPDAPAIAESLDAHTDADREAVAEFDPELEATQDEMLEEARRLLAQASTLLETLAGGAPPPPAAAATRPRPSDAPPSPEALDAVESTQSDDPPSLDDAQDAPRDAPPTPPDASPSTPSEPSAPSASRGSTPEAPTGEISDRESDGMRTDDAIVVEPGRPLAAKGLEIRTVRPRWSHYTLITANPKDAIVRVRFGRDGSVVSAVYVESSGRADVDRPVMDAIYQWRASGRPLLELPEYEPSDDDDDETSDAAIPAVELLFRIVLRR